MPKKAKDLEEIATEPIHFDVFSMVQFQQLEHGIRRKDYERYRKFCARKLRRFRKAAKTLAKEQSQNDVHNDAWIALLLTERAWTMAQEVQFGVSDEIPEDKAEVLQLRRNVHAKKRLARAAKLAAGFMELMQEKADQVSALDAEAYCNWITAEHLRSVEQYAEAWFRYAKAQAVYGAFQKSELRHTSFLTDHIQLLSVRMQICRSESSSCPEEALNSYRSQLASMESTLKKAGNAQKGAVGFISLDDWMGEQIMLSEPHAQKVFGNIRGLKKKFSDCKADLQRTVSLHLKLMHHFYSVTTDSKLNKDANVVEYAKFFGYVHNMHRYWIVLTNSTNTQKCSPKELQEKWQEYDGLIEELSELKDWSRDLFNQELKIHELFCATMKAYIVGQSYIEAGKFLEAFSIGQYAEAEARQLLENCEDVEFAYLPEVREELTSLCDRCGRQAVVAKTEYIITHETDAERVESGIQSMGLSSQPQYLGDRKNDFNFYQRSGEKLIEFPLKLKSLLPKPCFLDCARMHMDFPDLSNRIGDEEVEETGQSWLGGWFG